jgi:hypothetical protein
MTKLKLKRERVLWHLGLLNRDFQSQSDLSRQGAILEPFALAFADGTLDWCQSFHQTHNDSCDLQLF